MCDVPPAGGIIALHAKSNETQGQKTKTAADMRDNGKHLSLQHSVHSFLALKLQEVFQEVVFFFPLPQVDLRNIKYCSCAKHIKRETSLAINVLATVTMDLTSSQRKELKHQHHMSSFQQIKSVLLLILFLFSMSPPAGIPRTPHPSELSPYYPLSPGAVGSIAHPLSWFMQQ